MRTSLSPLTALAIAAMLFAGAALAQRIDMRSTSHNLARGESMDASDPRKICVFCHTPVDAGATGGITPLWQRSADADKTFVIFDDIGMAGHEGMRSVGSQSIACLSCHDTAQAFGVAGGSLDHPYAVPYRGALTPEERKRAREEARKQGRLFNPAQHVRFDADFRNATRGVINNRPAWWVSPGAPSAQRGRLDIPLFVRIDDADQTEIPFIECASCHDPHNTAPLFLRIEPERGTLCMTCHVK